MKVLDFVKKGSIILSLIILVNVGTAAAQLVAEYHFDGNANDATGNGHDGALVNGPVYVAGISGQALSFDGSNDRVEVADHADLEADLTSKTWNVWVKVPSDISGGSGGVRSIISKFPISGNEPRALLVVLKDSGFAKWAVRSPPTNINYIIGTTDELSDSLVKYGTSSGSYTLTESDATYVTNHSVNLTNLSPSTTYYYVVNSTDPSGNSNQSNEQNFTTQSPPYPTPLTNDVDIHIFLPSGSTLGPGDPLTADIIIVNNGNTPLNDGIRIAIHDPTGKATHRTWKAVEIGAKDAAWIRFDEYNLPNNAQNGVWTVKVEFTEDAAWAPPGFKYFRVG